MRGPAAVTPVLVALVGVPDDPEPDELADPPPLPPLPPPLNVATIVAVAVTTAASPVMKPGRVVKNRRIR